MSDDSETSTHHSASADNKEEGASEEIVGLLVECGADVNIADEDGNTPLHAASLRGNISIMKKFLSKKANPNHKNKKGYPTLHFVCLYNLSNAELMGDMKKLFSQIADRTKSDDSETSTHHSASVVDKKEGASEEIVGLLGDNPIRTALMEIFKGDMKELFSQTADRTMSDDSETSTHHSASVDDKKEGASEEIVGDRQAHAVLLKVDTRLSGVFYACDTRDSRGCL
ncbi:hypothetical protein CAPTEDRAFT_216182 [Capitella teleta]|uniref:Uncharacterized protein n=1 Tax=Capitella teleta TaxID=283909 RepID=R7VCQ1_CAPTE|nr:hypothetical protein CAPTEDRAFT_216182 [Capitella teleta]|eukprot:ELU13460.1 hypothetical protein CAPTEDRAFT_216182 [Capitella teleta]